MSTVAVALGSDFNPNAHCMSMPSVMHFACVLLRLTMNEVHSGKERKKELEKESKRCCFEREKECTSGQNKKEKKKETDGEKQSEGRWKEKEKERQKESEYERESPLWR